MTDAQLQALVAVAETGSFTTAGRRLGLTQSAVSHAITSLEESLAVMLIDRAARGARLTDAGARIVAHAREVLRHRSRIQRDAEASRRLEQGQLRIGSFGVSASRRMLPALLQAFAKRYPGVGVMVLEGSDEEALRWLGDGEVDVAFVRLPCDDFDATQVAEDRLMAVIPARHKLAERTSISGADVVGTPFIMDTGGCEPLIMEALCHPDLDVRFRMREVETVVAMVARGMGIAAVPRLALPDEAPAGVAFVPLATDYVRRVGLAVRKEESADSPARALQSIARRADLHKATRL
jgi:DNA-binding transcriptional LysR family regulator